MVSYTKTSGQEVRTLSELKTNHFQLRKIITEYPTKKYVRRRLSTPRPESNGRESTDAEHAQSPDKWRSAVQ
jgi:hypothetical protein